MIAIISGIENEITLLRSRMDEIREEATVDYRHAIGSIHNTDCVLVHVDKIKTAIPEIIKKVIEDFSPEAIVVSDIARPLVPYLQQGDMVIPEQVLTLDAQSVGVEAQTGTAGNQTLASSADAGLLERFQAAYAMELGAKSNRPQLLTGLIISGVEDISDRKVLGRLHRDFAALALDPEADAINHLLQDSCLPYLMVRTIMEPMDSSDDDTSRILVMPEYFVSVISRFLAVPQPQPISVI